MSKRRRFARSASWVSRRLALACRIRMDTLCAILASLTQAGRIRKTPAGYQRVG